MVLVALLTTAMLGMLAFTADFGLAFANKRQLQTAADAAALGAAGVFATSQKHSCSDVLSDKSVAANAEATAKVSQNAPAGGTAALTTYTASCAGNGIEVAATVTGTSPNFFGKVLGRTSDYQLERTATTVVEAATGAGSSVRPMAICSADLPSTVTSGTAFLLHLPGDGLSPPGTCPIPPNSGNWWTLDCPNEGNDDGAVNNGAGNSGLVDQIKYGCSEPVTIVPGQGTATGNTLNSILQTACPSVSTAEPYMCLGGDPGQPDAGKVEDSWKYLIDNRYESLIPVFCAPSPGLCDHSSVTGTGTNAIFPVHKFVGVTVCGYHFGKQSSKQYAATLSGAGDLCSPAATELANIDSGKSDDDRYLVLVFLNVQVSGSTTPSTCKLGDPCDTGVRQVRMIK